MKKSILTLLIVQCLFACTTPTSNSGTTNSVTSEQDNLPDSVKTKSMFANFDAKAKILDIAKIPTYSTVVRQGSDPLSTLATENSSGCTVPTQIKDLKSATDFQIYKFSSDMSAGAKAMGFDASIGKNELVFIEDYTRYQDVDCGGGNTKRYGIGLRCYIHVNGVKASFTGGLPAVAANVQLNKMDATFRLKALGFGIDGKILGGGATAGTYDVDNFGKLAVIFNNVLSTLNDDNTMVISPVELPKD